MSQRLVSTDTCGHVAVDERVSQSPRCVQVSELELWMDEQRAGLESRDCGWSEEATEALLKKLDCAVMELEQQRKTVERLQESGVSLQHLGHPDRYHHTLATAPFSQGQVVVLEWSVGGDRGAGAAAAAGERDVLSLLVGGNKI